MTTRRRSRAWLTVRNWLRALAPRLNAREIAALARVAERDLVLEDGRGRLYFASPGDVPQEITTRG